MPEQERTSQRKQWDTTYASSQDFFGSEPSELALSALKAFRDRGTKTVLELGCGQGRDTWYFAKQGLDVTALDYSEAGICQMRERAKDGGVKVALEVHDARKPLPFPDGSFDAIYSHMFFTMEFSEDEISYMLGECLRVLRPNGLNIYSVRNDHDPHYGKFTPRGKDTWENPLGFVVHFFSEEKIRRLATGYDVLWVSEFEDRSPPFIKKLYEVALKKPGG
jgi:ubiquinone/menaquinone biosynthesis C-methylase UbiE